MGEHAIPKGVDLETFHEIIVGWAHAGAADEPTYTSAVEDETGITDAVGRQTRFLEELGVLERDGQKHELTDVGEPLATALDDADDRARELARDLLDDWPPTRDVRGILRDNPLPADRLHALLGGLTGHDPSDNRVTTGLDTLLDLYAWSGVLEREDETYRLPDDGTSEEDETALGGVLADRLSEEAAAIDVDASPGTRPGSDALALSLDLSLDAEPDEIEALVRAIRSGLTEDANGDANDDSDS